METLAEYLDRLMRQNHLTAKELAKRCGLADGYISRVRKGSSGNLTVGTIMKLATALNVNPHEIFSAASGVAASEASPIDPHLLLDQMQKLITDTNGLELLRQLLSCSPEERKLLLDYIEYFRRPPSKGNGRPGEE